MQKIEVQSQSILHSCTILEYFSNMPLVTMWFEFSAHFNPPVGRDGIRDKTSQMGAKVKGYD